MSSLPALPGVAETTEATEEMLAVSVISVKPTAPAALLMSGGEENETLEPFQKLPEDDRKFSEAYTLASEPLTPSTGSEGALSSRHSRSQTTRSQIRNRRASTKIFPESEVPREEEPKEPVKNTFNPISFVKSIFTRKYKFQSGPLIGHGSVADAEQNAFTFLMMVSTLFALWGTDLYELSSPDIARDPILYTIVAAVFFCFLLELVFYTLFKPAYFLSFFFFLDLLATVSLISDILMLWHIDAFPQDEGGGSNSTSHVAQSAQSAARAGTRAARVVRLFKLFSLLRRGESTAETKIGGVLTQRTTHKVIIIVALMLIFSNLLDVVGQAATFAHTLPSVSNQLNTMEVLLSQLGSPTHPFFKQYAISFINNLNLNAGSLCPDPAVTLYAGFATTDCAVRYLSINGTTIWGDQFSYGDLRTSPLERKKLLSDTYLSTVVLDITVDAQSEAVVNLCLILFIALLLGVSQALFAKDAYKLVISPLETMSTFVRHLQEDPLHPMVLTSESRMKLEAETKLVVDAMMKLSAMLQVGFGDAGKGVIQRNMQNKSQAIIPVIPGRRIQGIYVFCDIRNFTDCTECLQTDVMVFVNRIAGFVHRAVVDNYGMPNKNIGDAFLLVWPLPEKKWNHTHDEDAKKANKICYADRALEAVVRIIVETAHDLELQELTNREAVQNRIPGYATKMGFGLHLGWGIEGVIGSTLKIDATYLSPNVNMSARLEGATKTYGLVTLMTEAFYDALSPDVQCLCRRVDRVTARGSNIPFDLFTYDAPRFAKLEDLLTARDVWDRFPPTRDDGFREIFEEGVKSYINGDWPKAHSVMKQCLEYVPDDGPAKFLLGLIEENNLTVPASWPGYRKNGVD